jgi:2-hydroxy-6-oxonona-2,4-dienedioate hydrolase
MSAESRRFEIRDGQWRRALAVASETSARPSGWGPLRALWVDTPQGRVCVRRNGGPGGDRALVFVHGLIVSSRYLLPIAAELADQAPVLVPDLPGFGLSAKPPQPPGLERLADAVVETTAAAGFERFALLGNSFGAQIAAEAALRHPERVERLVLMSPIDGRISSLWRHLERWLRCAPDEHPSILPVMARDLLNIGPRRAAALIGVMLGESIENGARDIAAPTLVVRGGRDHVAPQAWVERLAALLPDGRLEVLPRYAHLPHWSGPLALTPILRRFLAE